MLTKIYFSKNINQDKRNVIHSEINHFIEKQKLHLTDRELIFCFGGDGTFLEAIQKEKENINQLLFINISRNATLGFFSEFKQSSIDKILYQVKKSLSTNDIKQYPLLKVTLNDLDYFYALNELKCHSNFNTVIYETYIGKELLSSVRSSGFYVSTMVGSSGFNKTANGPLLLTPGYIYYDLFPVNNNKLRVLNNHFVLDDSRSLFIKGDMKGCVATCDGRIIHTNNMISKIDIELGKTFLHVLAYENKEKTLLSKWKESFL